MKYLVLILMLACSVTLFSQNVFCCSSNFDCELGSKCVKAEGDLYGVCMGGMNPGNSNDREPVEAPMDPNKTYGNTCSSDFDCGMGSKCVKSEGHMYGTCLKKGW